MIKTLILKNLGYIRKYIYLIKNREKMQKTGILIGEHHKSQEAICENCGDKFINHESKKRRFCSFSCCKAFRKGSGAR